ncbi:LuxR C-terminal-related transcriptional regulator [Streptomyces sp. NPDC005227]|uniref:helix-turn-helix transcriptional regulator n=1 Tax=Streptomyces sp. NPDC005227 TaxID=3364707 RepID=UPI0036C05BFD
MSDHIPLTERDVELITYLSGGFVNEEIASLMGISDHAVKKRTTRMASRVGITGSRQQALVDYAYRHGYLTPKPCTPMQPLPPRLAQILTLMIRGLGFMAIAADLGISPWSVRAHQRRLHDILGAETNAQAVAIAWEAGLMAGSNAPNLKGSTA